MEYIDCPFCKKGSDDEVVIQENGYAGRLCKNCNLIYISPRPTIEEIAESYRNREKNYLKLANEKRSLTKILTAKHNLSIVRRFIKKGRILEIGSGGGEFLKEARKKGFAVHGIELNKGKSTYIREVLDIPCENEPLSEYTFGEVKFDVIYHCNVISHLYNPILEFRKMYDRLNENGVLVFQTSNIGDVINIGALRVSRFQYPDHLFFFSNKSIEKLLSLSGFKLKRKYCYSSSIFLYLVSFFFRFKNLLFLEKVRNRESVNFHLEEKIVANNNHLQKTVSIFRIIYGYIAYFLQFIVGKIIVVEGHLQTQIIVAQKK